MIKNYKSSLVEPLNEQELHIFNANYEIDRLMKEFIRVLRDEVHGCYLLGGFRGTGKTSFIRLCCAGLDKRKLIRVHLDCSKLINVSNFLYFLVDELVKVTNQLELPDVLLSNLQDIHNKVINKIVNKKIQFNLNKETTNDALEEMSNEKLSVSITLLNKMISFISGKERHIKSKNEKNNSIENSEVFELEVRNDEFVLLEQLAMVFSQISKENYQVLIIIDEVDKQTHSFLEELFGIYKNLFLNSHLITVFVVDPNIYQGIVFSDEIDDKLKVYFTRCFYLPTFRFKDIKDYMYREFEVHSVVDCLKATYLSNGTMRKINTYSYMEGHNDPYLLQKAFLLQDLLSEAEISLIHSQSAYVKDKFKFILKDILEKLFYARRMERTEVIGLLQKKFDKHNIPVDPRGVIECLEKTASKRLDLIFEWNDIDNVLIKITPREEYRENYDSDKYKISYQFNHFDTWGINRSFIKINSEPIPVMRRDTRGFEHVIRMIETNIRTVKNIIIVRKISNWDEAEVHNYSAVVIMDKPVGCVVYIVEECSFSYEGPFTVQLLIDFMVNHKIPEIMIDMDDEPVLDNLAFIFDEVDKKIYPR
ncbi:Archaeal ATPase [compost metagenome]